MPRGRPIRLQYQSGELMREPTLQDLARDRLHICLDPNSPPVIATKEHRDAIEAAHTLFAAYRVALQDEPHLLRAIVRQVLQATIKNAPRLTTNN